MQSKVFFLWTKLWTKYWYTVHDIQAKNEQWIILGFLKRKFVEFCDRIYAFINGLFPKMNSRIIIDILDLSSLASMIHLDNVMQYL